MAAKSGSAPRTSKRVDRNDFEKFLNNLGSKIEALIDATPLGVTVPEPWCPSIDKKKAFLSNPVIALSKVGEFFDEAIDAFHPFNLIMGLGSGRTILMNLRDALANAILVEETIDLNARGDEGGFVVVVVKVDTTVPSEGAGEPYVDLGVNEEKKKSETSGIKKTVTHFLIRRALNFIDVLTLKANGIIVTSDDCSVECSLASRISDDDFENFSRALSFATEGDMLSDQHDFDEDSSSVVTEAAEKEYEPQEDYAEEDDADAPSDEDEPYNEELMQDSAFVDDDAREYVVTDTDAEEPVLVDDEDFVDVRAEFNDAFVHP